jgi:hypothetical protein
MRIKITGVFFLCVLSLLNLHCQKEKKAVTNDG